ncbi:eukaryotic translation initiation factor 3 subunit G, putative (EIF3G) [Plasmodium ovale curtisi]|uniref:Eukaryotic translation initiation factor 3 subunit G, putative (EIF3G) n=1 Tax=Plasmodium ovale curtisi TaxID=864141 RepID=A0A1A8VPF2_PLAOA|nr:eukaryotic translation initiation factor 3 subunit G, putative (EIF3G) [Plasmodium ovale curtisi]
MRKGSYQVVNHTDILKILLKGKHRKTNEENKAKAKRTSCSSYAIANAAAVKKKEKQKRVEFLHMIQTGIPPAQFKPIWGNTHCGKKKKWVDIDVEDDESLNDNENKKKWEDIDADDDIENNKKLSYFTNYENGVKVVTKYTENLKKQTVKVTKKIKEVVIKKRLNKEINNRLNLKNFNIDTCSSVIVEPTDVVNIEAPKNNLLDFLKDSEYDYLFAEQTDKTAKDLKNRFKMFKDEETEEIKPEDPSKIAARKDMLYYRSHVSFTFLYRDTQNKECTIRVTNLSEDVNISRMFLAKHKETHNSKGFAFITYSKREEAKRAIEKLNRHGFENLLLSVEWAKPSNR